jgi:hypothetical protein
MTPRNLYCAEAAKQMGWVYVRGGGKDLHLFGGRTTSFHVNLHHPHHINPPPSEQTESLQDTNSTAKQSIQVCCRI